jgi:threonine/homoserine/homoserine lactone efflux protein
MNVTLLVTFWGVAVLLIVVPGPDWAFVLASGLRDRTVIPAVGGLMIGYALLTAIVAAGVGTLITERPMILTVISAVGAGYLILLGAILLARPTAIPDDRPPDGSPSPWGIRLATGIGVSALNPKGLLMFLALLPQFTRQSADWSSTWQIGVLGLVFVLSCGAFYAVLGTTTRVVFRSRLGIARTLSRISGVAMIGIGIALVIERIVGSR